MDKPQAKPFPFFKVFEPPTDFYQLLSRHIEKVLAGVCALDAWFREGADGRCQLVRDLEHEADEIKLEMARKLVDSLITPFDREDINDLSVSMDEIINACKATVREMEALEVSTDNTHLCDLTEILIEGTQCLVAAFAELKANRLEASAQARLAQKCESRFTKCYRQALKELFELDDIKKIFKTHEIYRCLSHAADRIELVGEKLLYSIVKMS